MFNIFLGCDSVLAITRSFLLFQLFAFFVCSHFLDEVRADQRTFTNKEGRQVTARARGWDATKVTLQTEDGRFFVIPISTLSLEDQAWLAEEQAKVAKREDAAARANDPNHWQRIEIELPSARDRIETPGLFGSLYRIGLKTWAGELPAGAWMRISSPHLAEDPSWPNPPELLMRHDGDFTSLKIEFDEGLYLVSKDGGEFKVAGVSSKTILNEGTRSADAPKTLEFQRSLIKTVFGKLETNDRICLQPAAPLSGEDLSEIAEQVDAIVIADPDQKPIIANGGASKMRAIRYLKSSSTFDLSLGSAGSLEYLSIDGQVQDLPSVAGQPNLKVLELSQTSGPKDLDFIATLRTLRLVKIGQFLSNEVQPLNGWGQMPSLIGIDFDPRRCQVSAESVSACTGLRSVRFEDFGMSRAGEWMNPLVSLKSVYWSSRLESDAITAFASRAEAGGIFSISNQNPTPFGSLTGLRSLVMPGITIRGSKTTTLGGETTTFNTSSPYIWTRADMAGAAEIEHIQIDGVSQSMFECIAGIQYPGAVKALILTNLSDCHDFGDLRHFTQLRLLSLSNFLQTDPRNPATRPGDLDLSALEHLEAVEILPNDGFAEVQVVTRDLAYKNCSRERQTPLFLPSE